MGLRQHLSFARKEGLPVTSAFVSPMEHVLSRGEYQHDIPVLSFLLLFMLAACTTPTGVYRAGAVSTRSRLCLLVCQYSGSAATAVASPSGVFGPVLIPPWLGTDRVVSENETCNANK